MVLGKLSVPGVQLIWIIAGQGPVVLSVGAGVVVLNIFSRLPFLSSFSYSLEDFRVVLGWAYRGLTGGFLLLQNFCVAISVSPHVCFILVLILISMFLR